MEIRQVTEPEIVYGEAEDHTWHQLYAPAITDQFLPVAFCGETLVRRETVAEPPEDAEVHKACKPTVAEKAEAKSLLKEGTAPGDNT